MSKIAESFKCNPVEGALSHKLKKHLIDGNDVIINKETPDQKVETYEFDAGDVFTIEVFISTGEGKPKEVKKIELISRVNSDPLCSRELLKTHIFSR